MADQGGGCNIQTRFVIALLGSCGMAILYGIRINISVALVAMVNHTAVAELSADANVSVPMESINTSVSFNTDLSNCGFDKEANLKQQDGPFVWTEFQTGIILSSYYWGYIISMAPGGRIAEMWSAKWMMFFAVGVNIISSLITPLMANWHYGMVVLVQVLKGIGGGVSFPSMHCIIGRWAPKADRSSVSGIVYAGTALGSVISQAMSGVIANHLGWEYVFYISGMLAMPWLFVWAWYMQDFPETHKQISEAEKTMLLTTLARPTGEAKPRLSYKAVFRSAPFWAILIGNITNNFGFYLLLSYFSFYLRNILLFGIAENGYLTGIPFITMGSFTIILGKILDSQVRAERITQTTARKIGVSLSAVVPATCVALVTFMGCERYLAWALLGMALTFHGAMYCGVLVNHIDIAPNFAGTLIGITNTFGTIAGIIVPGVVGVLTRGNQTLEAWRIVFSTAIVAYFIEFVVFLLCGSGEEQPWNKGIPAGAD